MFSPSAKPARDLCLKRRGENGGETMKRGMMTVIWESSSSSPLNSLAARAKTAPRIGDE